MRSFSFAGGDRFSSRVVQNHRRSGALASGGGSARHPRTYRLEAVVVQFLTVPNGTWSDPMHQSGYFMGSTELGESIRDILSYALPNRGFAAGSRAMQAPNLSYWKSNSYLTSKFTGESDALHPQWVIIDLKAEYPVSAIRIAWVSPYATAYRVEYRVGTGALDFDRGLKGEWKTFPMGQVNADKDGSYVMKLADEPVSTEYVWVLMTASSNICDDHGPDDVRNCVGYAIQDIHLGTLDSTGAFVELQTPAGPQPPTRQAGEQPSPWPISDTVSSIGPRHAAVDVNVTGSTQHTDLFFTSGITNNLQAMIPETILYGTLEDAAAEIAYIEKRGYPIYTCS